MRSLRSRLTLLAVCSVVWIITLLFTARSQSLARIETPEQAADALDAVLQPRFLREMDRFGVARIIPPSSGHAKLPAFQVNGASERQWMRRIHASAHEYSVFFLHCAHSPGKYADRRDRMGIIVERGQRPVVSSRLEWKPLFHYFPEKNPPGSEEAPEEQETRGGYHPDLSFSSATFKQLSKLAVDALPQLKKGKEVDATLNDWYMELRPVVASQRSCLNCHAGAKSGETLGVMVYAVRKHLPDTEEPAPLP